MKNHIVDYTQTIHKLYMKNKNHIEEQSVIWLKPRFVKGMCMHTTQLCPSSHNPEESTTSHRECCGTK